MPDSLIEIKTVDDVEALLRAMAMEEEDKDCPNCDEFWNQDCDQFGCWNCGFVKTNP